MNLEKLRKILTYIVVGCGFIVTANAMGMFPKPIPHEVIDWAKSGAIVAALFGKSFFGWIIAPNAPSIVDAAQQKVNTAAAVGVVPSLKSQMDAAPGVTPTSEMLTPPGGKRS